MREVATVRIYDSISAIYAACFARYYGEVGYYGMGFGVWGLSDRTL